MQCTLCSFSKVRVIDSRSSGATIRRRRECTACGHRYTTYEIVESHHTEVIKMSGRKQQFDRDKLSCKIALACHKTGITPVQIEEVVESISDRLQGHSTITSKELGLHVLDSLRPLSTVAYTRFASVYHRCETAGDMVNILSRAV